MSRANQIASYGQLTITERIELLQRLWDEIADSPDSIELTAAQRAEIDRRSEDCERDPDAGIPWTSLRASLARPK